MEKSGLLERIPHESDGRAKRVRVLPLGLETFHQAQKMAFELQSNVLYCLSVDESRVFLALLERIGEAAAEQAVTIKNQPKTL